MDPPRRQKEGSYWCECSDRSVILKRRSLEKIWWSITRVCGHTDTTSGVQRDRYIPWAATHLTIFNIRLGISAARIDQKFHGLTAPRAIDGHRYDQGQVTLVGVASGVSWMSMMVPFPI